MQQVFAWMPQPALPAAAGADAAATERRVLERVFRKMQASTPPAATCTPSRAKTYATAACADVSATHRAVQNLFGKMRASAPAAATTSAPSTPTSLAATYSTAASPDVSSTRLAVEDTFRQMNDAATTPTHRLVENQRESLNAIFDMMNGEDMQADATQTRPPKPQGVPQYLTMTLHELLSTDDSAISSFQLVERSACARATSVAPAKQRASVDGIFNLMHDGDLLADAGWRPQQIPQHLTMTREEPAAMEHIATAAVVTTEKPQAVAPVFRNMEVADQQVLELAAKQVDLERIDNQRQQAVSVPVRVVAAATA